MLRLVSVRLVYGKIIYVRLVYVCLVYGKIVYVKLAYVCLVYEKIIYVKIASNLCYANLRYANLLYWVIFKSRFCLKCSPKQKQGTTKR